MESKTTERFIVYLDDSLNYETAEFEAKDLFDFAREMSDWFGGSMEGIILILDKDKIDTLFWNEYEKTCGNSAGRQNLLKRLVDSYKDFLSMEIPKKGN